MSINNWFKFNEVFDEEGDRECEMNTFAIINSRLIYEFVCEIVQLVCISTKTM